MIGLICSCFFSFELMVDYSINTFYFILRNSNFTISLTKHHGATENFTDYVLVSDNDLPLFTFYTIIKDQYKCTRDKSYNTS